MHRVTYRVFWKLVVVFVLCVQPVHSQPLDTLPHLGGSRLETELYIPDSIEGLNSFMRMRDLSSTDEFLIRNGVQTASKQSWGRETADYMVFVWTEVYIFDSAKSAQSIMNWRFGRPNSPDVEDPIRSDRQHTRLSGLPVVVEHEETAGLEGVEALYGVSYQQGRLGVRVEVRWIETGIDDLRNAEKVARRAYRSAREEGRTAFEAMVETAQK